MIIELISVIAGICAVAGVVLNNRKMRLCFPLWIVSNFMCLCVHWHTGLYALCVRDAIFCILAIEGMKLWQNTPWRGTHYKP